MLASLFNLLWYIIFIEADEENSASRYVAGKGGLLGTSQEDLSDSQESSNHTLRPLLFIYPGSWI